MKREAAGRKRKKPAEADIPIEKPGPKSKKPFRQGAQPVKGKPGAKPKAGVPGPKPGSKQFNQPGRAKGGKPGPKPGGGAGGKPGFNYKPAGKPGPKPGGSKPGPKPGPKPGFQQPKPFTHTHPLSNTHNSLHQRPVSLVPARRRPMNLRRLSMKSLKRVCRCVCNTRSSVTAVMRTCARLTVSTIIVSAL